jgi:hypothetical protein
MKDRWMVKVTDENGAHVAAQYYDLKRDAKAAAVKAWAHVRAGWRVEVRDMRGPRGLQQLFPIGGAK